MDAASNRVIVGGQPGIVGAGYQAGDVDGDAAADLIIGRGFAPSTGGYVNAGVYLVRGREEAAGQLVAPHVRLSRPGSEVPLHPGSLSTELGLDVRAFVRSPYGSVRAKLEVELKGPGEAFDATDLVTNDTWLAVAALGTDLDLAIRSSNAPSLLPGTGYHGRVRVRWDPSLALPSTVGPWWSFDPSDPADIHFRTTYDGDGDGFAGSEDCDDEDPAAYPGAPETPDDGIDQDCEGSDTVTRFEDTDGDTFGSISTVLAADGDCDDDLVDANPDFDSDCDDADSSRNPDAAEACNGVDDNCDGEADEGLAFSDWFVDDDADGFGGTPHPDNPLCAPAAGYIDIDGDCDDADIDRNPDAEETCNDVDDDCDGEADEGLTFTDWFADEDTDGFGVSPHPDDPLCIGPEGYVLQDGDCDDILVGVNPDAVEVEGDPVDEDCDGVAAGAPTDEVAIIAPGISCSAGGGGGVGGLLLLLWRRRPRARV